MNTEIHKQPIIIGNKMLVNEKNKILIWADFYILFFSIDEFLNRKERNIELGPLQYARLMDFIIDSNKDYYTNENSYYDFSALDKYGFEANDLMKISDIKLNIEKWISEYSDEISLIKNKNTNSIELLATKIKIRNRITQKYHNQSYEIVRKYMDDFDPKFIEETKKIFQELLKDAGLDRFYH